MQKNPITYYLRKTVICIFVLLSVSNRIFAGPVSDTKYAPAYLESGCKSVGEYFEKFVNVPTFDRSKIDREHYVDDISPLLEKYIKMAGTEQEKKNTVDVKSFGEEVDVGIFPKELKEEIRNEGKTKPKKAIYYKTKGEKMYFVECERIEWYSICFAYTEVNGHLSSLGQFDSDSGSSLQLGKDGPVLFCNKVQGPLGDRSEYYIFDNKNKKYQLVSDDYRDCNYDHFIDLDNDGIAEIVRYSYPEVGDYPSSLCIFKWDGKALKKSGIVYYYTSLETPPKFIREH